MGQVSLHTDIYKVKQFFMAEFSTVSNNLIGFIVGFYRQLIQKKNFFTLKKYFCETGQDELNW